MVTEFRAHVEDYSHHTAGAQAQLDRLNHALSIGDIEEAYMIAMDIQRRMAGVLRYCDAKQGAR